MGRTMNPYDNPRHKYSREVLYHYTCGQCGHWWSYAHTVDKYDLHYPKMLEELTCPHCEYTTQCEENRGAYPYHEYYDYRRPSKLPTWGRSGKGWQPKPVRDFLETDQ